MKGKCTATRIISLALAAVLSGCLPLPAAAENTASDVFYEDFSGNSPDSGWSEKEVLPEGWLLWHSYSDYSALDSILHLRTPDGITSDISGSFIHAMNGSFGNSPDTFTFMAIDKEADEWDIFLSKNGSIVNLTEKSGYRNEDPKFSPDGRTIVFKRGHWDRTADGFVYDLALLDTGTREVTMLTDNSAEEAMPCFSPDGKYIYYSGYKDGIGSVYRFDRASRTSETVYSESGVNAYYPAVYGSDLFFTKWYSADDRCDQIMRFDGSSITSMPFNSPDYDCSDACPAGGSSMIFSSTMNGSYDLYCFDGNKVFALTELNSGMNDLGAAFFPYSKSPEISTIRGDVNADGSFSSADLVLVEKWLLGVPGTVLKDWKAADLSPDGRLDAFDMCLMRREMTGSLSDV